MNTHEAWDRVSATYRDNRQLDVDTLSYGPFGPTEATVKLLGDVRGRRVLDVGCGAGQACVALARQGAQVSGIDFSEAQLDLARKLAVTHNVSIEFVQGRAEDLTPFPTHSQDVILSVYTFHYIATMAQCLRECARVLDTNGRLIFSLDHPFRDCFFDEAEQEDTIYPARSYFDTKPLTWPFGDTGVRMQSYHRTIAQWVEMIQTAGFRIGQLLEPKLPNDLLDELWPEDDPLTPRRNVPQTIIFVAEKAES